MPDPASLVIRPRRSLLTTAFVSIVLAMVPLFGVLYWFAADHGSVTVVLVVHLVVIGLCLGLLFRQLAVFSAVDATHLSGNGIFSPLERVALDRVAQVDLVETYVGSSAESVTQLLIRDAQGRRLYRLRGAFWHPADVLAFADALPVRTRLAPEPISIAEFFREYPGSAYWFENRPALIVSAIAGAVLVVFGVAVIVMGAIGMPIGFLPR